MEFWVGCSLGLGGVWGRVQFGKRVGVLRSVRVLTPQYVSPLKSCGGKISGLPDFSIISFLLSGFLYKSISTKGIFLLPRTCLILFVFCAIFEQENVIEGHDVG